MSTRSFLGRFDHERECAVTRLLQGVPKAGGSAKRDVLEEMVRSAFNGGLLAAIQKCIVAEGREEELQSLLSDTYMCAECGKALAGDQVTFNFGNQPLCRGGCPPGIAREQ